MVPVAPPSGKVAFLFTDIEGSTVRWDRDPQAMQQAVRRHDDLFKAAMAEHHGYIFKTLGDAFCVAFADVYDAIDASVAAQRMLGAQDFSGVDGVGVRMAIHVGESDERDGDYFGPTLNRVARLLAVAHGGQIVLSGAVAGRLDGRLPRDTSMRDLGEHRLKDLTASEHVFQLVAPDLRADFPKLRSLNVLNTNLPSQITGFVGREQDLRDIQALLVQARLVTLCGAGGVGKTRCALQAGADAFERYGDGVWFADLAALSDPLLVPAAVAAIFDLQESPGRPVLDSLLAHLKQKHLLLILDNCEHLVDAVSTSAAAILRACPKVTLLATSREALNLTGESVYRMPSLDVAAAIELFRARACAVNPRFSLEGDNARIVAQVCTALDGIPLAIELAAARMRMLSPAQLAQKLGERFRILTGGDRTALPRQQTMRALIDWSYDLLVPVEQRMFRLVSIFAGGFTLDAAIAVGAAHCVDEFETLELLSSLVDKSLVLAEPVEQDVRYRLLESTRQYAREKLIECAEQMETAAAHAHAYTQLAETLALNYEQLPYRVWLCRAERELENIRASLTWSFGSDGNPRVGERLAATLHRVFGVFAAAEARRWVQSALERVDDATPPLVAARLQLGEAFLASAFNQFRSSLSAAQRALAAFVELHDEPGMAEAQRLAGRSLVYLGRVDEGEQLLRESLVTRRQSGSWRVGGTLRDLAAAHGLKGDVTGARELFAQASAAFEEGTDEGNVAITAATLAEAEFRCGDAQIALGYAEKALDAVRKLGRQRTVAAILGNIAAYYVALDRYEPARAHAREALALAREVQVDVSVAFALQHLAAIAALQQSGDADAQVEDRRRAAWLMGFVDARLLALETAREYTEQQEYDRVMRRLRQNFDEAVLRELCEEGRRWTQDRAVAAALLV